MPTDNRSPQAQWTWNFTDHTPTPQGVDKIENLRGWAKNMATAILAQCPEGREKSLSLTHLEESLFYAVAAVARTHTQDTEVRVEEIA